MQIRDNNSQRADELQRKIDEQKQFIQETFSDLQRSFPELMVGFNKPIIVFGKSGVVERVVVERIDSANQIVYRKSTSIEEFRANPASVFLLPIEARPLLQIDVFALLLSWSMNAVEHFTRLSVCALPDGIIKELEKVIVELQNDGGSLLSELSNTRAHDPVSSTFSSKYPILSELMAPKFVLVVLDTGISFWVPFTYEKVFSDTVEKDVLNFIEAKALHTGHENDTMTPHSGYSLYSAEFLVRTFSAAVTRELFRDAFLEKKSLIVKTTTNLWCCNNEIDKPYGFLKGGFMYTKMELQLFILEEFREHQGQDEIESKILSMLSENNMADLLSENKNITATHATSPEAMKSIIEKGLNSSAKSLRAKYKHIYTHTGIRALQDPIEMTDHNSGNALKQFGRYGVSSFNAAYLKDEQCKKEMVSGTFSACGMTAFANSLHIVINTVMLRMILGVGQPSPGVVKTRDSRNLCTGFWAISMQKYFEHIRGFVNHRFSPPVEIVEKIYAAIGSSDNTNPVILASSFAGISKGGERSFGLVWIDKNNNGKDVSQKKANLEMMGDFENKPVFIINTRQCFSSAEKEKALEVHRQVINMLTPLFADEQLLAPYRDTRRSTYIEKYSTVWSEYLQELRTSLDNEKQKRLEKLREAMLPGALADDAEAEVVVGVGPGVVGGAGAGGVGGAGAEVVVGEKTVNASKKRDRSSK